MYIKQNHFNKAQLEREMLAWMPYKVREIYLMLMVWPDNCWQQVIMHICKCEPLIILLICGAIKLIGSE